MYNPDNESLLREVERSIGLTQNDLATIEFGIKSYSEYANTAKNKDFHVYAKDFANEKSEYAQEGVE
jgi:hypothetical protein